MRAIAAPFFTRDNGLDFRPIRVLTGLVPLCGLRRHSVVGLIESFK